VLVAEPGPERELLLDVLGLAGSINLETAAAPEAGLRRDTSDE